MLKNLNVFFCVLHMYYVEANKLWLIDVAASANFHLVASTYNAFNLSKLNQWFLLFWI